MRKISAFENKLYFLSIIAIILITFIAIVLQIAEHVILETTISNDAIEIAYEEITTDEGQDFNYYIKEQGDSFEYEYTASINSDDINAIEDNVLTLLTPYIQSEAFEVYINDVLIASEGDTSNYNSSIWTHKFYYDLSKELFDQDVNEIKIIQYSRYMTGGIGENWIIDSQDILLDYIDFFELDFPSASFGVVILIMVICLMVMFSIQVNKKKYLLIIIIFGLILVGNSELFISNDLGIDYFLYKKLVISSNIIAAGFLTVLFLKSLDFNIKVKFPLIIYSGTIIAVAVFAEDMIIYKSIYDYYLLLAVGLFSLWIYMAVIKLKYKPIAKVILAMGVSSLIYILGYWIIEYLQYGVSTSALTVIMLLFMVYVIIVLFEDIHGEQQLKEMFAKKSEEFVSIFNNSQVGIVQTDQNGNILKANMKTAKLFGYESPRNIIGKNIKKIYVSDEQYKKFQEQSILNIKNHKSIEIDYELCKKDGSRAWMAVSGSAIDMNSPADLSKGIIWTVSDINVRRETEAKLLELSRKDTLTGVNNRRYFMELGNSLYEYHERYKRPISILMIDIDFFKNVNDEYGHDIGDKAIKYIAEVCTGTMRNHDVFGRLGGEEFAAILVETSQDEAVIVAERMRKKISNETPQGKIPALTISIGVYTEKQYEPFVTLEKAIKKADENLYIAKKMGRNQVKA